MHPLIDVLKVHGAILIFVLSLVPILLFFPQRRHHWVRGSDILAIATLLGLMAALFIATLGAASRLGFFLWEILTTVSFSVGTALWFSDYIRQSRQD